MTRLRTVLSILTPALLLAVLLTACYSIGVAHAAQVVDPVATAHAVTDGAASLISTHGWLGGALLVYAGMSTFLQANQTKHWIAAGRTLAIITGLVSIAGAAAAWKFSGGPLEAVLEAVIGAIALIVRPTVQPVAVPQPEAPATQNGGV